MPRPRLPTINTFHDTLSDSLKVTAQEYDVACRVCRECGCESLNDDTVGHILL